MGNFLTIVSVILTGIGVWVAIIANRRAIKYDYKKDPLDERTALLALFKATRFEYEELIKEFKSFCAKNNLWSAHIEPGITYISFIQALEDVLNTSFNDQMFSEIKSLSDNKPAIEAFMRNIELKHTEVSGIRARLHLIERNLK